MIIKSAATALERFRVRPEQPDGSVELDQHVHVAGLSRFVARDRSKEGETRHAEAYVQHRLRELIEHLRRPGEEAATRMTAPPKDDWALDGHLERKARAAH